MSPTEHVAPLNMAASKGFLAIVRILADSGADLDAVGEPVGARPLHSAALSNQAEIAGFLIGRGAAIDSFDLERRTPLIIAATFGHRETVALLLERGSNIDVQDEIYGMAPIHWAAGAGHAMIVDRLLSNNGHVDQRTSDGQTALHIAYSKGRVDAVRLLADHDADFGARNRNGVTVRSLETLLEMHSLKDAPVSARRR